MAFDHLIRPILSNLSIDIGSNTPISQSILIMVITAAAVVGVVVIVYVVYRRKNPAFGF